MFRTFWKFVGVAVMALAVSAPVSHAKQRLLMGTSTGGGSYYVLGGTWSNALNGHRLEHKRIVQGIYALLRPLDDEEKLLAVMVRMHLEPGRRRNPVVIEHEQRTERGIAGIEVVVERQKARHTDGAVLFRMTCG